MALTFTVAKNTVGTHSRVTVEIDLRDPFGRRPTGPFWQNILTLRLCHSPNTERHSAAPLVGWPDYEGLVERISPITQRGAFGQAFPHIPDCQIILQNKPISGQVENSLYNFSSGSGSHNPEPTGIERKLSELFQFYAISGAAVRVNLQFYATASTDENIADFVSHNIFTGKVEEVDTDSDFITLDCIFDTTVQDYLVGGKSLKDSPDKGERLAYAPILFGNYNDAWAGPGLYETGGFEAVKCVLAGLIRPQLTPTAIDEKSDEGPYHIINDAAGVNTGWTLQTKTTDNPDDSIWLIDEGQGVVSKIYETTTASVEGAAIFENRLIGGSTETEQRFRENAYLNATAFVPCGALYSESSAGLLINPENLFDGDPFTYAELPIDSTSNWIMLRINKISPLGSIIHEENTIRAQLFTAQSAATAGTEIRFGIYRTTGTDPWYIGTDSVGTPRAVYGVITPSAGNIAQDERDQNTNTDNIRLQDYIRGTGPLGGEVYREALMDWNWRYSIGGANGEEADLTVRIHVETAGAGGETLRLVHAGILVEYASRERLAQFARPPGERTLK